MVSSILISQIEAILYLKARPLKVAEIAEYAQVDRETALQALGALMALYHQRPGALEVVETPEGYSLQLRNQFQNLVQTLIPVDLGVGALRTLAAIAINRGITQTELVDLRGSGAYQQVQTLVEQGFVQKRRHKETRSYWLQVTDKFHRYFQTEKLPKPLTAYGRSEGSPGSESVREEGSTDEGNDRPNTQTPGFEQLPLENEGV
jgi:segregation and condensation protein B